MRLAVALLVTGVVLHGCGGDDLSLSVTPELRNPDEPTGRSLGIGLIEDFGVELVRCPPSIDHPDCSSEPASDVDVEWSSEIASLEDSEAADFSLLGLATGAEEIVIDASGVDKTRFVVKVEEVLFSQVFFLFSSSPDQGGRELVFAGSESIPFGQVHYATKEPDYSRPGLLGYAPMQLSATSTEAKLLPDDVSPARRQLWPGNRVGSIAISTTVGGDIEVEIVDGSAIDGFDTGVDQNADEPLQALSLSVSGGHRVVHLRPWNLNGRRIRGNGGPIPEVLTSTSTVEIIPTPESSVLPWEHSFAVSPNRSGDAEITVRWGNAQYTFEVTVSED